MWYGGLPLGNLKKKTHKVQINGVLNKNRKNMFIKHKKIEKKIHFKNFSKVRKYRLVKVLNEKISHLTFFLNS